MRGILLVSSEEEFDADEVRAELRCVETKEKRVWDDVDKRYEDREVSETLHSANPKGSEALRFTPGFEKGFQFSTSVPAGGRESYSSMDASITWSIKGVIGIKGRPDVTSKTVEIQVKRPTAPPVAAIEAKPQVAELKPRPTSCTRCAAPLGVSLEDVIVTCQYCGNTITVATHEEIKKHSMLENRLYSQQALEAARDYMDKGILRRAVAEKTEITDVKLRYVPFWVFPVAARTYYRGQKGLGVSELREIKHAATDKKRSRWSKLGKIAKAATELAIEGYATRERGKLQSREVSNQFSSHYNWTTLARRAMLSDIDYYEVPLERKIPFDTGRIPKDADFFNTELMEEEARARVGAEVDIKQRELAGEEVDSVDECRTTVSLGEGELIHSPVWFVNYRLEEEDYAIAVDGSTGKVLGGGRPMFKLI